MSDFIDPVCAPDVFATDLVSVEDLGGVFRFNLVTVQNCELVLATRVCLLSTAVPKALQITSDMVVQSANPLFKAMRASH